MTTFADLGVPEAIERSLSQRDITTPFPIQEASIPDALAGRDILGRAPTGSGKTLAFGIPLMARVGQAESKRPRALVLAPTRELADQISKELIALGKATRRWTLAVYGGVGYEFQRRQLRRGVDVLVATPGRLADLIGEGSVSLRDVEIAVVDEADRMADMGFMPQVRELLDQTADERQTMMFSATLDGDVAELTRRYQTNPVRHEVEGGEDHGDAAHYFWSTPHDEKVDMTADIIGSSTPTIVFTRTRRGADRVAQQLERRGVKAAAIHGGRSQNQRTRALKSFTDGRVKALIATDVAARGIHVDNVASVVHFDLPEDPKDYLHRSGRTARAGENGVVVSLVGADQRREALFIQQSVGLPEDLHNPNNDWLTGESGHRIGDAPIVETRKPKQHRSAKRRPHNGRQRSGNGPGRSNGGGGQARSGNGGGQRRSNGGGNSQRRSNGGGNGQRRRSR